MLVYQRVRPPPTLYCCWFQAKLAFFDALVRREVEKVQQQLAQNPTQCNVQLSLGGRPREMDGIFIG